MDVYEQSIGFLRSLPGMDEWQDLQALYCRIASGKPRHWILPVQACEAVGGESEQAIPAVVATACAHISIILVDDMLDNDPRGEYHQIGEAAAANLACAFQAAGLAAISQSECNSEIKVQALRSMNQMILATTLGQAWDVRSPLDEAGYWRVTETKSSPFFGTALQIGALFGGAPADVADRFYQVGAIYGQMIQVHDDMGDVLEIPANPDWTQHRSPLPILFARSVEHVDRSRFLELCEGTMGNDDLLDAQGILIRSGAISYCIDQLFHRHQAAENILETMTIRRRDKMDSLLEEVIAPIRLLLQTVGKPISVSVMS